VAVLVINRAGRKIWRQTSYKLEASFQRVSKSEEEASFAYRASVSEEQLSLVNFFRGNWADAFLHAQASCPAELGSSLEGSGQGILFRQMAYEVIATARSQSLMRRRASASKRPTEQPRFVADARSRD
jgi:hypothetical protein